MTAMDYTTLPRGLIYRERKSLEEFTDGNKLNTILVENMEDIDFMMEGRFVPNARQGMNAAYYICTEIRMESKPSRVWSVYTKQAHCQSGPHYQDYHYITLAIVLRLLQGCDREWLQMNEKLVNRIIDFVKGTAWEKHFSHHSWRVPISIISCPPDEFAPRDIRDNYILIVDIVHGIDYVVEAIRKFPDRDEQKRFIKDTLMGIRKLKTHYVFDPISAGTMIPYDPFPHAQVVLRNLLKEVQSAPTHSPLPGVLPNKGEQQAKPSDQTALEEELARTKKRLDEALSEVKERDQKIAAQEAKIAELQEQIDFFQGKRDAMSKRPDLRGGVKVGLTRNQARAMTEFLTNKLKLNIRSFKGGRGMGLGYIAQSLWGYSAEKVRQNPAEKEDREYVASIFAPFSPDIAKEISDTGKKKSHHTGEKKA